MFVAQFRDAIAAIGCEHAQMPMAINDLTGDDRERLIEWIGERPEATIAIAALMSGVGRVSIEGDSVAPFGVLVESSLLPGEPQGFGDAASLLRLLATCDDWTCIEVSDSTAAAMRDEFAGRWGSAPSVIDVIHVLDEPVADIDHPLVRQLTAADARRLVTADDDLFPERQLAATAAEHGRVHAGVDDGVIVGHGGAFAVSRRFADVGVHVARTHRRAGMAAACASKTCRLLQRQGFTPVWGTSSENAASLATARRLGFVEVARLTYLVRGDAEPP